MNKTHPKLLDLKPDRRFLNSKFEGYKLSLDNPPLLSKSVPNVKKAKYQVENYGFLQLQMVAYLNNLYQDPYDLNSHFYVSSENNIIQISLTMDNRFQKENIVSQLPSPCDTVTLSFPSPIISLVCNGLGQVDVFSSLNRSNGEYWNNCFTFNLENCKAPVHLATSTHRNLTTNCEIVEFILAHISSPEQFEGTFENKGANVQHVCLLEWITLTSDSNYSNWALKRRRRLIGGTFPKYISFETSGDALFLVSESNFSFIFDSEGIEENTEKESESEVEKDVKPLYTFLQTLNDITLTFIVDQNVKKEDVEVNLAVKNIDVSLFGKKVLECEFYHEISLSTSTWSITDSILEVFIVKAQEGNMWPEVLIGDQQGKEIVDPEMVERVNQMLTHLTVPSQDSENSKPLLNNEELEECDNPQDVFAFVRIDGNIHSTTHKVNLGSHQWIFAYPQSTNESLPNFCIRHDVDGLVWQVESLPGETEGFRLNHISTFNALGYVQASKQNRKFVSSPNDSSYVVLCDSNRHVFIYLQPNASNLYLRNRKTSQVVQEIAKQHVICLEDCEEILGLQTTKDHIFILTGSMMYAFKMNSTE